jgi:hypothetical protein
MNPLVQGQPAEGQGELAVTFWQSPLMSVYPVLQELQVWHTAGACWQFCAGKGWQNPRAGRDPGGQFYVDWVKQLPLTGVYPTWHCRHCWFWSDSRQFCGLM